MSLAERTEQNEIRQDQSARGGQAGFTGSWASNSKLKTLGEAVSLIPL